MTSKKEQAIFILLRVGLAFSFFYAAVSGWLYPSNWIGYFPGFLQDLASEKTLLTAWGILEAVIALWILTGKRIFVPSLVASILLVGMVVANFGAMDVLFRDISLAFMAMALTVWGFPSQEESTYS